MKRLKAILCVCLLFVFSGCGKKYETVEITKENIFDYFEYKTYFNVEYDEFGDPIDASNPLFLSLKEEYEADTSMGKSDLVIEYSFVYDFYEYEVDYDHSQFTYLECLNENKKFPKELLNDVRTEQRKFGNYIIYDKNVTDDEYYNVPGIALGGWHNSVSLIAQWKGFDHYANRINLESIEITRVKGSIQIRKK